MIPHHISYVAYENTQQMREVCLTRVVRQGCRATMCMLLLCKETSLDTQAEGSSSRLSVRHLHKHTALACAQGASY